MSKTEWLLVAVVIYLLFFRSKGQATAPRALTEDEIAERNMSADGLTPQQGCRSDGLIGCYVGGGIPIGSPLY